MRLWASFLSFSEFSLISAISGVRALTDSVWPHRLKAAKNRWRIRKYSGQFNATLHQNQMRLIATLAASVCRGGVFLKLTPEQYAP